jgi:hypothetical protein
MRMAVIGLVLLASFKVWSQDRTYRAAMSDALVEAYRDRAIEVCRKIASKKSSAAGDAIAWTTASDAQVVMGNPDVEVAIWDTENPLWTQHYRNPQLVLATGRARCAYDVRAGSATLTTN